MASSTTAIPPMPEGWTACGACTSGSIAHPRGATSRVFGGATTTRTRNERRRGCRGHEPGAGDLTTRDDRANFPPNVLRSLGAAVRRDHGGHERLVHLHVGDESDANARRLDDADDVDADAGTNVARRCDVVPRHVGRDDAGHDAAVSGSDVVALSPGRLQDGRASPRPAD